MEKELCPYHKDCSIHKEAKHPFIQASGVDNPDVLVIGEAPQRADDAQGANFMCEAGQKLRDVLKVAGFDERKLAYTTVMKCMPKKERKCWNRGVEGVEIVNREPSAAELKRCKPHVIADIARLKPKLVILCGGTSLKALTGMTGVKSKRGRVYTIDGIDYLPTFAPASFMLDPANEWAALEDCRTAFEHLYQETVAPPEVDYKLMRTTKDLIDLLDYAKNQEEVCFDLETSCLSPYKANAQIVCCGFSFVERESWIVPLYSYDMLFTGKKLTMALDVIRAIMGSDLPKIAQNGKFDISWLKVTEGIDTNNFKYDTMLMQFLLSEQGGTHALDYLTWKYAREMGGYDDPLETYKAEHKEADPSRGGSYRNIPWDVMVTYAGGDTDATLRVKNALVRLLK